MWAVTINGLPCLVYISFAVLLKSGASTDLCTGLLKNAVAFHLHRNTKVYGCFLDLDTSKAVDKVSHNTLFKILGVPPCITSLYLDVV